MAPAKPTPRGLAGATSEIGREGAHPKPLPPDLLVANSLLRSPVTAHAGLAARP